VVRRSQSRRAALSWKPIDPNYANRTGYDRDFLGIRIQLPKAAKKALADQFVGPFKYQHFSIVMHRARKLAAFTAVNIDGSKEYRFAARSPDSWHADPRAEGLQTMQAFYKLPFNRGHLVMRVDPAWGTPEEGLRAEADTFHWTNCSPQHAKLNNPRWLGIEEHILDTANNSDRTATVFSGPLLSNDPVIRKVAVPLAFWKVLAWKAGRTLRSLAFLVKQDDLILPLVRGVRRAALGDFTEMSPRVRTWQTSVAELENLTGLQFGRLASPSTDVYRAAAGRRGQRRQHALAGLQTYRPILRLDDLVL
jgi:endonuclease G